MKKQETKEILETKREELTVDPTAALNDAMMRMYGTDLSNATEKQVYRALCIVVREFLTDKNYAFDRRNAVVIK